MSERRLRLLELIAGGAGPFEGPDTIDSWTSKKYRAAKSLTPFIELGMAAYFVVTIGVAFDHGHYLSIPFLALFLCGFGCVGWLSLWQGGAGRGAVKVVPPPAYVVMRTKSQPGPRDEIILDDETLDALVVAEARPPRVRLG